MELSLVREWGSNISMISPAVWIALIASCLLTLILANMCLRSSRPHQLPLPPGPCPWPIVGSMLQAKDLPHQWFAQLGIQYGPIIYLRMGSRPYVVVNNAELAKEILSSRDADFAFRPRSTFSDHIGFGYESIVFRPCDAAWRRLRKLCASALFTISALKMSTALRQQEIAEMVSSMCSAAGSVVNLRRVVYQLNLNTSCRLLYGRKYFGSEQSLDHDARVFLQSLKDVIVQSGKIDTGDLFPALRWLDLQDIDRTLRYQIMPALEKFHRARVAEHRENVEQLKNSMNDKNEKDLIDVMLSLKGEESLSDLTMCGILNDLILGGTDTTTVTIEWAFIELLARPEILRKAQAEIDSVVGKERLVRETDLLNLPYVQAIIKETLRLHPALPMGVPHCNPAVAHVAGYRIPAGSTVLINIWAIGRDPATWINPTDFNPDRFLGSDIQCIGQHFQLLPFSAGRRRCPGYLLALIQVPHVLATLLHAFDWSLPAGQRCEKVNMQETMGMACYREAPVEAAVSCRLPQAIYRSSAFHKDEPVAIQ